MTLLDQIKPCDTGRPYIFISYSSLDRELVWQDVLEFQRRGYNIWLDDKNLDKTKDSWKKDALAAIESFYCKLLVFYISHRSLTSPACYQELCHTKAQRTRKLHKNEDLGYIAIEAEQIGNIKNFYDRTFISLMECEDIPLSERESQAETLYDFVMNFFDTNNEKVRVLSKDEPNRKMDYYSEVTASFEKSTKIFAEEPAALPQNSVVPQDSIPTTDTNEETSKSPFKNLQTLNEALRDDEISDETVDFVLENAEQLEAETWYMMGCKYKEGLGVEKDPEKAAEYFQIAAERGHADAQFWLACAYRDGEGLEKNQNQYFFWLQKAAEQEQLESMTFLALHLGRGESYVKQNVVAAKVLMEKIAEKDSILFDELCKKIETFTDFREEVERTKNTPETSSVSEIPQNPQETTEPEKIPLELIEEAVKKFWTFRTFSISEASPKERRTIQKFFNITFLHPHEELFCFFRSTSLSQWNTFKEGLLVSNRSLYLRGIKFLINKEWYSNAKFDLLNIDKILPSGYKDHFDIYFKDGHVHKNCWTVYTSEIVEFLNYIIENRPQTDNH